MIIYVSEQSRIITFVYSVSSIEKGNAGRLITASGNVSISSVHTCTVRYFLLPEKVLPCDLRQGPPFISVCHLMIAVRYFLVKLHNQSKLVLYGAATGKGIEMGAPS